MSAEFEALLPETVKVTACRTYAVPEVLTSEPRAESVGSLVQRAQNHAVGRVTESDVSKYFRVWVSKVFERLMLFSYVPQIVNEKEETVTLSPTIRFVVVSNKSPPPDADVTVPDKISAPPLL